MSNTKFATMGKEELRAACRAAGISYGKLNNDGMRAALVAKDEADWVEAVAIVKSLAFPKLTDSEREAAATVPVIAAILETETSGDEAAESNEEPTYPANPFAMMCDPKEFAAKFTQPAATRKIVDGKEVTSKPTVEKTEPRVRVEKTPAPIVPRVTCKGYTIQKEREERNGKKRPSEGTVCGAVWSHFDANPTVTAADLTAIADANGWNRTNVACEYYGWRKFMGITGRGAK